MSELLEQVGVLLREMDRDGDGWYGRASSALQDLRARVTELEKSVHVERQGKDTLLQEFCNLQVLYGTQKHEIRTLGARVAELVADVKEWMCSQCRCVYPGPPSPGFDCVMCPVCRGFCAPRTTVELREAKAKLATMTAERDALNVAVTLGIRHRQDYIRSLNKQLAARTYTWTTARPTVAGGYWVRHAADDEPYVAMVDDLGCVGTYRKPLEECDGWEWAGPISQPQEVV